MKRLKRWLCRMGWHDWRYVGSVYHYRIWRCERCGTDITA